MKKQPETKASNEGCQRIWQSEELCKKKGYQVATPVEDWKFIILTIFDKSLIDNIRNICDTSAYFIGAKD